MRHPDFPCSVLEVIRRRTSCRTYQARPLPDDARQQLAARLRELPQAPFGGRVRLVLLDSAATGAGPGKPVKLGTYGVIRNARSFLAGAVRQAPGMFEDFGFVFEWALLQATALGLGTCWLGGTLRRGEFGRALQVAEDEALPAVSPVGLPQQRRSLVDSTMRLLAGSRHRKPFAQLFSRERFGQPLAEADAGEYAEVLQMVRLGPSASNNQPWRVVLGDAPRRAHLFIQRTPGYDRLPGVDLQRVDAGIALCHFELSAQELGLSGRWQRLSLDRDEVGPLPPRTEYVASWLEG